MRTRLSGQGVRRGVLVTCVVLTTTGLAFAQGTSTINGRVLDQGDAVLPGVTVTATNTATSVARTTVTNGEGVYSMPGLDPGVYGVKTELTGFATALRDRVTLTVNSTITIAKIIIDPTDTSKPIAIAPLDNSHDVELTVPSKQNETLIRDDNASNNDIKVTDGKFSQE